jgi:hypothetical protein
MYGIDRIVELNDSLPLNTPLKPAKSNLYSLASVWARRYVNHVNQRESIVFEQPLVTQSVAVRQELQAKLSGVLRLASAQSWAQTEQLLHGEIERHGIRQDLINPWEIAADTHQIYEKVIQAYTDGVSANRLSLIVGNDCGKLRHKYTQNDPRLIGFVSLQCHYTGQSLLSQMENIDRLLFAPYLKVVDDHLYMPLRETFLAAATYDLDAEALRAVQRLLAVSTRIARSVYKRVRNRHPGYETYSGRLNSEPVRVSSIRDVEMFQIYLCLCLLEGNVRSVQEQLFPLCVMLYPRLKVSWELVQAMLEEIGWEMHRRLLPGDMLQFLPYLRTLSHMFSREVFAGR